MSTDERNSTSSLYSKLTTNERNVIDRAIVDRSPPTIAAAYRQFNLADRGISYSAFYRYASRIRREITALRTAVLLAPTEREIKSTLSSLLASSIIDVVANDKDPSGLNILRLVNSYSKTVDMKRRDQTPVHIDPDLNQAEEESRGEQ